MKTVLLALLLPMLLFSQEDYETQYRDNCRGTTVDALNFMHDHDFKAYPQKDNLVMDIDFNTNCHSNKVGSNSIAAMKDNARHTACVITIKDMPSIINTNDICKFKFYIFNIIYRTDDFKYYTYSYYLDVEELYSKKSNLSERIVSNILLYKE